ncbi:MAG: tyrosine-protein phosphatase [Oligoflexia bacterium]|nr:tyrosine-protein phosphatase [Oligoflexia bacterium]MBF0363954.1 tyrosine-protein phosphatase [Oligoflexia bacterium]
MTSIVLKNKILLLGIRAFIKLKSLPLILVLLLSWTTVSTATAQLNPGHEVSYNYDALNFGVVVNNDHYQIYRSSQLGIWGLRKLALHLKKNNLPFPKTIIYMNSHGYIEGWLSGEYAVEEYKHQETYGYKYYHSFDYNYRTYLDGFSPYQPSEDIDNKSILGETARELFGYYPDGKNDGGVDAFIRIMNIILDPANSPILFHCYGGRHRTGIVGLALRYLQGEDWINGPQRQVFVLSKLGKVWLNPAQYEYYKFNKLLFRQTNLDFIQRFSQEEPFLSWKQSYGRLLNE